MRTHGPHPLLRAIRRLATADELRDATDAELLGTYVENRNEAAFELLVHRHGDLVWRVCRHVLRDTQIAEDAFQATFLILVRKADSIARPELLANWLYGVAHRVAVRARKGMMRQQARQRPGVEFVTEQAVENDLSPLLQEELQRLPDKYRAPMLLCYLEGQTNEEAARQLAWPVGTLKVRLLRGRELLRRRLSRRGLILSAAALVAALGDAPAAAAPPALVEQTIRAAALYVAGSATGLLSARAVALTEGVLRTMCWTPARWMTVALVALGVFGAGLLSLRTLAADEKPAPSKTPPTIVPMKTDLEKLQGTWHVATLVIEGQKLPDGANASSKIVVQGNDFTTISMGSAYRGTFKVDADARPKTLDMHFTEGPEKGNTALGIYELAGDTWKICLTMTAKERPQEFAAPPASGLALETLKRDLASPDEPKKDAPAEANEPDEVKKERSRLEGEWAMVSGEIDGQPMPDAFVKTGKRVAKGNETTVTIGGNVFMKATYTIDPSKKPKTIDYTMTEGLSKGKKQLGIYELDGDTIRFCFASPGKDRPTEFSAKPGAGNTLSVWKRLKEPRTK